MSQKIPTTYEPKDHEDSIYKKWEESRFFGPDVCIQKGVTKSDAKPFSIVLPPPNVTGTLHLGHAAMLAIEDIMVRYHRMKGDKTLWIPGTDHAAIATQEKVERILWNEEKKTRHDLGREVFLERVKKFAQDSHDTIVNQCKKMGASLDWDREAYTLDNARNRAVNEAFRRMFEDGIIYRGSRIVNWDPKFQTTVSDDEVERREEVAPFYYLQYGPFVIGTARPETKFGDKYIVVHPNDERYREYAHGQKIENIEWINRKITATVIKDDAIDMSFGTGAMTITPWHDATDFDIAERHHLDKEQIISYDGKLLSIAGEFSGMDIAEARPKIIEKLRKKNLVVKTEENYLHNIAVNSRGGGIIEPQIKEQWFVNVNKEFDRNGKKTTLKSLMQEAVRSGEVKIIPERFEKTYFHWIDNLRDWCISRQIWFGHRIPVWYCIWCNQKQFRDFFYNETTGEVGVGSGFSQHGDYNGNLFVDNASLANMEIENGMIIPPDIQPTAIGEKLEMCPTCKRENSLVQDPDTLDTWFSSGLWTFSTLGWPEKTKGLETYHPISVLETGYDILFFWVARMILMSEYLLGEVPFKTTYLHGLIRDEKGRKMSKSLGNVIDPLDMTTKYGTDAVRLSLVIGSTPGNDIRLGEEKIATFRNFTNKLWNIGRYVVQQSAVSSQQSDKEQGTISQEQETEKPERLKIENCELKIVSSADRWILSRLDETVRKVTELLESYQFSLAGETLRDFTWNEFADWYVEAHKVEGNNEVLRYVFETLLKLWHPFMPFVTETLWSQLEKDQLLLVTPWPKHDTSTLPEGAKENFSHIIDIITKIRAIRSTYHIDPKQELDISFATPEENLLAKNETLLKRLARVGTVSFLRDKETVSHSARSVIGNTRVCIHLETVLDLDKEQKRLEMEIKKLETFIENTSARLDNEAFTSKAPKALIENTEKLLAEAQQKRNNLHDAFNELIEN
jgi:valyl-tRNA synthetase